MKNLVTISIASKDRHEDVELTLQKLHQIGLGDLPLILCDDGSTPVLTPPSIAKFSNARILRNEIGKRQALARNRIVDECQTPYVLQLDDDSYPTEGDLMEVVSLARSLDNWLALALPFEEPIRGRSLPELEKNSLIQIKSFVGCSAFINVSSFRKLNGYASWVGGYGEEEELCIRGLIQGFTVWQINTLKVRHNVSEITRDVAKIAERSFSNWLIIWFLYAPSRILPWRVLSLLMGSFVSTMKLRSWKPIYGFCKGFFTVVTLLKLRDPLNMGSYKIFQSLPHALSFFK